MEWVAGFSLSSQPLNCILCEFLAEPHVMFSSCHLSGLCYWYSGSVRLLAWASKKRFLLPFLLLPFGFWSILIMLLGFRLCFCGNTCSGRWLLLSDSSIREVRVGMNCSYFCFDKLQICTRTLGCLWAVSLVRSPKAEIFHIWKMCPLYMDCVSMPPSPSSSIFFHCLI